MMRPITPEELHFPYPMETNAQLIDFANLMLRPHPSKAVKVFMIIDIIQCVITFIACAHVVAKKGRMRDAKIFTLRKSAYGTFIVPNAVWVLLTGVCTYLLVWAGFCSWIVYAQRTNRPLAEWLWFIPFPW